MIIRALIIRHDDRAVPCTALPIIHETHLRIAREEEHENGTIMRA